VIIEVGAGSSAIARAGAALVLGAHITGGIVGMLSGATALAARKGSRLHRRAGTWFFAAMLVMSAIGTLASPFLPVPNWGNLLGGAFTFYLVASAWMTVRRPEGQVGRFEVGALLAALAMALGALLFALIAVTRPGSIPGQLPLPAYLLFALCAVLAAAGDLRLIRRGGIHGAQRIRRHLWRMCVGLFAAAGSFFLGQQQVFPPAWRGSPVLFLPEAVVLGLMVYWLVRLRAPRAASA